MAQRAEGERVAPESEVAAREVVGWKEAVMAVARVLAMGAGARAVVVSEGMRAAATVVAAEAELMEGETTVEEILGVAGSAEGLVVAVVFVEGLLAHLAGSTVVVGGEVAAKGLEGMVAAARAAGSVAEGQEGVVTVASEVGVIAEAAEVAREAEWVVWKAEKAVALGVAVPELQLESVVAEAMGQPATAGALLDWEAVSVLQVLVGEGLVGGVMAA